MPIFDQDGYSGLGWTDVERQLEGITSMPDAAASELPPQFEMVSEVVSRLRKLFKNYNVKYQVGVSRNEGSRWVYENIW